MLFEFRANDCCDIYFETRYGEIYSEIEGGTCLSVKHISKCGTVMTTFIRREVPFPIGNRRYYDIITPYGFGGPLIVESSDDRLLVEGFVDEFQEYCDRSGIICEFVRFHTLLNNAHRWSGVYDVKLDRKMIAIDLTRPDFRAQFKSNCRNNVRRAVKCGVRAELDLPMETMDEFIEIYYRTMRKNNADRYYFFPKSYFERLARNLGESACIINARLDGRIISSSLFIHSKKYAHCHLSATLPEFYPVAGNNLILDRACEYFQGIRCQWLHLGGGLTDDEADSLFAFKRTFGRTEANLKEYFVGKKVWNPEIYQKVMDGYTASGREQRSFFPEYRQYRGCDALVAGPIPDFRRAEMLG